MMKLFKNLTKKDVLFSFICVVLIIFQVWLDLKMPDYMSEITKLVETEGSKISDILTNGGYMLLCSLGSLASAIVVGYLAANISASFSMRTRKKIFNKVEELGVFEVKKFSTSSLITRTTNDITQLQTLIAMGLQMIIKAPINAVWAVTKILNKSWQFSSIVGIAVLVLFIVIVILMIFVIPKFKIIQKLTDKLNGSTRENLTGIRVVRAFNAEEYQETKFKNINNELTNTQLFTQKAMSLMSPIMYLVMYGLTLGIYFVGAYMIDAALMQDKLVLFGDMIVFSSYGMQVIMSFLMLVAIFMIYPRAQVSANRINEVLDTPLFIKDKDITLKPKEKGTVEFVNVSFKYPDGDEDVIKNISFKAKKGETVAFIGSTGSGKTTLINLIPRFYDVTEGSVLVDGIDVRDFKQTKLRNLIGYVSQRAIMFYGSVKSNVLFGDNGKKKATNIELKQAIKIAQAEEFVSKMDKGYNSHIAASGTNISGGQKQRLSIARAIARKPEIYIFDDSFSALDYKTDLNLRKNLKKYTKDATVLIVAQRIGTIMNADKIIVLDNGECVGMGTHKELLKKCDVYKEIALSQLSEEELKNA